jgi:hypothetical protein
MPETVLRYHLTPVFIGKRKKYFVDKEMVTWGNFGNVSVVNLAVRESESQAEKDIMNLRLYGEIK